MNREIKFRAWDTIRSQFVGDGEIVFRDYGDTNIEVHPNSTDYIGDSVHNGEPQGDRFIASQYTGLKDKKGKEIYEGDIVKWDNNIIKGTSKISFYDGAFRLSNYPFPDYTVLEAGDRVEIIGNIYENPELL